MTLVLQLLTKYVIKLVKNSSFCAICLVVQHRKRRSKLYILKEKQSKKRKYRQCFDTSTDYGETYLNGVKKDLAAFFR